MLTKVRKRGEERRECGGHIKKVGSDSLKHPVILEGALPGTGWDPLKIAIPPASSVGWGGPVAWCPWWVQWCCSSISCERRCCKPCTGKGHPRGRPPASFLSRARRGGSTTRLDTSVGPRQHLFQQCYKDSCIYWRAVLPKLIFVVYTFNIFMSQ